MDLIIPFLNFTLFSVLIKMQQAITYPFFFFFSLLLRRQSISFTIACQLLIPQALFQPVFQSCEYRKYWQNSEQHKNQPQCWKSFLWITTWNCIPGSIRSCIQIYQHYPVSSRLSASPKQKACQTISIMSAFLKENSLKQLFFKYLREQMQER